MFLPNYMGSLIELNDTLQITTKQGFPADLLNLEKRQNQPLKFTLVKDNIFSFHDKQGARVYHTPPTRCFLVHNISGRWLYWGKILIVEQTIQGEENQITSGKFKIIELYDPEYQQQITKHESPDGKSYL